MNSSTANFSTNPTTETRTCLQGIHLNTTVSYVSLPLSISKSIVYDRVKSLRTHYHDSTQLLAGHSFNIEQVVGSPSISLYLFFTIL